MFFDYLYNDLMIYLRDQVRAYIIIFSKNFKSFTAYPAAVFWGLVSSFLFFFIQASIWFTLLGEGESEGIGFKEMVTFLVINSCSQAFSGNRIGWYITKLFKSGDLAITFSRPLSFKGQILSQSLGAGCYNFFIRVLPLGVLVLFIYGLILPPNLLQGAAFLLVFFFGVIIGNQLSYLISLGVFWFKSDYYTKFLNGALITIFAGTTVPIWFYPEGLQKICSLLPYQLMIFQPVEVYFGRAENVGAILLLDLFWILVLGLLEAVVWKKAKNVIIVQGG